MKKLIFFSICAINAVIPFVDKEEINQNIYRIFGENPSNCTQTTRRDVERLGSCVRANLNSLDWLAHFIEQRIPESQINNAIFDATPSLIRSIATEYLGNISYNQMINEAAIEEVVREIQIIINRNYSRRYLPNGLLGGYLGESLRRQLGNRAAKASQLLKERENQYSQNQQYQDPITIFHYEECCVCLDKFNYQNTRPVVLKCGHAAMCTVCVKEWHAENSYRRKNFTCPICRKEMDKYEIEKALCNTDKDMPAASAPRFS